MRGRELVLFDLGVGDIFHAESPNGASLICLTIAVTETEIHARTVTTQQNLQFDRETGVAEWGDEPVTCIIDSVEPLPVEIYNIVLGLDRKFRLERDISKLKLSDNEMEALIYLDSVYSLNKI